MNISVSEELNVETVVLEHAARTEIKKTGAETMISWQGDVRIVADGHVLTCDTAEWYTGLQKLILEGNIFCKWDEFTASADNAVYERHAGLLRLRKNIHLISNNDDLDLTAGFLEYSMQSKKMVASQDPVLTIDTSSEEENKKIVIRGLIMEIDSDAETFSAIDSATIMVDNLNAGADTLHYYPERESAVLTGGVVIVQNAMTVISDNAKIWMTHRKPDILCAVGNARSIDQINETFNNSLWGDSLWLWWGESKSDSVRSRGNARGVYYPENDSGVVTGEFVNVEGNEILLLLKDEKADKLIVSGMATGSYRFQRRKEQ